ncbi:hypothetical protein L0F63_001480 [Massospora cicadina]|nr:hypothetical protein L0F63_001480 [Massospora cicadina]
MSLLIGPLKEIPSPLVFQLFPIYYKYILARGDGPFIIHEYHQVYGPTMRVGWDTVLFVDQDAANLIYGSYQFDKAYMYKGFNYFGENLLSVLSRDQHAERRRMLGPAFTQNSILKLEPRIMEVGIKGLMRELELAYETEAAVNIYDTTRFMLWDVTCDISLGSSMGMLDGQNLAILGWMRSVLKYGIICAMFPIFKHYKPNCLIRLRDAQETIMQRYISQRETNSIPQDEIRIFDILYDHVYEDGKRLSYDQMFSEAHVLLVSGTNTVSTTISLLICLVLKHPEVHKKLCDEVREGVDGLISYHQCKKLPYVEAVIHEVLRLYPVASIPTLRITPSGGRKLGDYFIPEKTQVGVPLYSLHRSRQLWKDPDEFLPERWLDAANCIVKHAHYLPFSKGPRACIGKELAWMEMKLVISNLFRSYQLSLVNPNLELKVIASPGLQPLGGRILIHVKPFHGAD